MSPKLCLSFFIFILKIQKGKVSQSISLHLKCIPPHRNLESRCPRALLEGTPLTSDCFRYKKRSTLPWALPLTRCPWDRHLRSSGCPALEAPALSIQRTLQPLLFQSRYGHLAYGSDGSVQPTNHTPGNTVMSLATNGSA